MSEVKTTKKVATKKTTTPAKESKTMAKTKTTTPVETKETTPVETKAVAPKSNAQKLNLLDIAGITALYQKFGIGCKNPQAKGLYRIMKSGSSLNIKPTKGYYIYSTDADLEAVQALGIEGVVCEKGTNAQDKARPNTVICSTTEQLEAVLPAYATNPLNKVVVEEKTEK